MDFVTLTNCILLRVSLMFLAYSFSIHYNYDSVPLCWIIWDFAAEIHQKLKHAAGSIKLIDIQYSFLPKSFMEFQISVRFDRGYADCHTAFNHQFTFDVSLCCFRSNFGVHDARICINVINM